MAFKALTARQALHTFVAFEQQQLPTELCLVFGDCLGLGFRVYPGPTNHSTLPKNSLWNNTSSTRGGASSFLWIKTSCKMQHVLDASYELEAF